VPSRIPHSPRRSQGSIGLVIERAREPGELDSLSWFVDDFSSVVLWEKYFVCTDLGKDLTPIVRDFQASEESKTGQPKLKPAGFHIPLTPTVPDPVRVSDLLQRALAGKSDTKIFSDSHPDKEFDVVIEVEGQKKWQERDEIFLFQIKGAAQFPQIDGLELKEGECCVIAMNSNYPCLEILRSTGSAGLVVSIRDVLANKIRDTGNIARL